MNGQKELRGGIHATFLDFSIISSFLVYISSYVFIASIHAISLQSNHAAVFRSIIDLLASSEENRVRRTSSRIEIAPSLKFLLACFLVVPRGDLEERNHNIKRGRKKEGNVFGRGRAV